MGLQGSGEGIGGEMTELQICCLTLALTIGSVLLLLLLVKLLAWGWDEIRDELERMGQGE